MKRTRISFFLLTAAVSLLDACFPTETPDASRAKMSSVPMFVLNGVLEAGIPPRPLKHDSICLMALDDSIIQPFGPRSDRILEGTKTVTDGQGRFHISVPMTREIIALRNKGLLEVTFIDAPDLDPHCGYGAALVDLGKNGVYKIPTVKLPMSKP
jgi:hypothetical protein